MSTFFTSRCKYFIACSLLQQGLGLQISFRSSIHACADADFLERLLSALMTCDPVNDVTYSSTRQWPRRDGVPSTVSEGCVLRHLSTPWCLKKAVFFKFTLSNFRENFLEFFPKRETRKAVLLVILL